MHPIYCKINIKELFITVNYEWMNILKFLTNIILALWATTKSKHQKVREFKKL